MSLGGDGDCNGARVPALYIGNNPMHALSVHAVAKATVEAVVQEAVEALAHAVVDAAQWLTGAVRDEVISEAVVAADSDEVDGDKPIDVEDEPEQHLSIEPRKRDETLQTEVLHPLSTWSPIAIVHVVAKATIDDVTEKAVRDIVQVVDKATEWITQEVVAADSKPIHEKREQLSSMNERDETLQSDVLQRTPTATIHAVAKALVDTATDEAVKDIVQAVERVVIATDDNLSDDYNPEEEREQPSRSSTESPDRNENAQSDVLQSLSRPSSAVIHSVAKATVDALTDEAVMDIVRAVEKATAWISQAVSNELVSQVVDPNEAKALHNATEWITQAVRNELLAHAVADAIPSTYNCTDSEEQQEYAATPPNIAADLDVPRLSCKASASDVRVLAKEFAESAVSTALHNVLQSIRVQAVPGELAAPTIVEGSPQDETHIDAADNSFTDSPEAEEPQQSSSVVEKYAAPPVHVPVLRLPNATDNSPEAAAKYHDQAVLLINEVFSLALCQTVPAAPPEPQEYEDDGYEDYTPINSPTSEGTSSRPPDQSTPLSKQGAHFVPPAIPSGRATPPETKSTPRRKSPITTKRALGTPTPRENAPSSAPPAIPSPRIVQEPPTDFTEPDLLQQALPPLALPAVQVRMKHQHTPRRTPRQSSPASNPNEEVYTMDSPRTSSSRLNKHTPRAVIAAEFELTPKSSARAAAIIYTQPPSSRHHHHRHKSKKLRDSASQTSPPPSPPSISFPCQPPLGTHDNSNSIELPTTRTSHSKRDLSSPKNFLDRKTESSNNTLLAPLSKTSAIPPPSTTKSPTSPSRTHMNYSHGHKGHGGKGHGGGPSPNKRSGYCPRCVFEGRSCKINDCLKHQILK